MIFALRRLVRSRRGAAAVEFALIAPFMLAVAAGIVEFGVIFKVYNGVDRLAAQYAIAWSDCSDIPIGSCATELGNYSSSTTVANMVPQLRAANLTLQMFEVQMNGATPTIVYAYPSGGSLTAAQTTAAQAALDAGQVGVLVTVTYQHSLQFFSTLMSTRLSPKLNPSYTVVQLKY